jgi:hypothetical protein
MCPDPEPVVVTVSLASEGAIAAVHFDSLNLAFLTEL